jgi:GrpB-like predicted nucleotidyltransferase (UPF0157 family)
MVVHRDRDRRDVGARAPLTDEAAFEAWAERRRAGDASATVVNLYETIARPRGLQAHELPADERAALSARALPVIDPSFQITPDSGRGDPIELVAYDPEWPARYEVWRARLEAVLAARRIDHIGSTAVPGLKAKPSIDIQVSVEDLTDEATYVPAIESLGVQLRNRDSEHRYFRPFAGLPRDVHVHVCSAGSAWERRHLLFVAFLRISKPARRDYLRAKEAALARWADDRVAYTEAKDDVIASITERAEEWARKTGWTP